MVAKIVNKVKPTENKINPVIVKAHGPAVTHNMPCSVCWLKPAVAEGGVFQPCWECQKIGWKLSKKRKGRV